MRSTRICFVINAFAIGGAETVVLDLARSLNAARYDVTAVAVLEPRPARASGTVSQMRRRFQDHGVKTAALHAGSFRDPRALFSFAKFLHEGRFDIIHGHNRPSDAWAAEIGRWVGVPYELWTRHLVYRDLTTRQIRRYQRLARRAPAIVAVSDTVRRACLEIEGLPPGKVVTITNGIDTARYVPVDALTRAEVRAELGIVANERLLLFVGRMNEQKAPDAFVRLVWRMRERGRSVKGVMCGGGTLAEKIQAMVATGPGGVQVLGVRNDVPALLGAADLFVSTSRNEGLPLNIMEAMSAATPVAAPALEQIESLMVSSPILQESLFSAPPSHGDVPEEQIAQWATRISRMLDDRAGLALLGQEGRRVLWEGFSLAKMVTAYETLYERILSR